jgi:hypothetical protein
MSVLMPERVEKDLRTVRLKNGASLKWRAQPQRSRECRYRMECGHIREGGLA